MSDKKKPKKKIKTKINKSESKYANKRTELQKQLDRELITKCRIMKYSNFKISQLPEMSHISYEQVCKDVHIIEEDWKNRTSIDLEKDKLNIREGLELIISESFEAWLKSKSEKVKKSMQKKLMKSESDNSPIEELTKAETIAFFGDDKYLKRAFDAFKELNKMFGHYTLTGDNNSKGLLDNLMQSMNQSYQLIMNQDDINE